MTQLYLELAICLLYEVAIATASARLKGAWPVLKTDRLPNPNDEREERERAVCAAANAEIQLSMAYGQSTTSKSRKRACNYRHYNSKTKSQDGTVRKHARLARCLSSSREGTWS